jgi:hypothetical protein
MLSCVLATDDRCPAPVEFSGVTVTPLGDPMMLVDLTERLGTRWLILAAPTALATKAGTAASVAASRWPDLSIARIVSPHAPLAILSALALAARTVQAPAQTADLVNRLLDHSWSGAWMTSLSHLTSPAPTLMQHVRSIVPGSGFLVRQSPDPAVLSGPRDDDVAPAGFERVLLTQHDAVPSQISRRFADRPGISAVRQVSVPGDWNAVYGTGRVGQLAVMPAEPRELVRTVDRRCPVCGLDLPSELCPFCRVHVPLNTNGGGR